LRGHKLLAQLSHFLSSGHTDSPPFPVGVYRHVPNRDG
jgi:hypothetical protein